MLDLPFLAAVIDVAISGKDVPMAIIVKPMNESDIFRIIEIDIAESTVTSAPKSVIPIASTDMGNPNRKGFLNEVLVKKSVSRIISSLPFASEFLKLLNHKNNLNTIKILCVPFPFLFKLPASDIVGYVINNPISSVSSILGS